MGNFNIMNGHISFGHEVIVGNCNAFMLEQEFLVVLLLEMATFLEPCHL